MVCQPIVAAQTVESELLHMKRFACVLLLLALLASCAPAFAQNIASDSTLDPDAVTLLQVDLIAAGYLDGKADGIMGSATQDAIRAAEEAAGLPVSGYMTEALSASLLKDAFPLQREARNSLVYRLQKRLSSFGFLEEDPTGYFGKSTEEAVKSFQELAYDDALAYMQRNADEEFAAATADIPDDVVVDQPLVNSETVRRDGVMTEDWYDFLFNVYEFPKVVAGKDDKSDGVKMVQKRLHALGYLYSGFDGVFGDGTELALKYFQRRNNLPETGTCDEVTSSVLFSENPVKSDEYVMPYMAYVKRSKSRVYIFGWDGEGYNTPVVSFKCSCGKPSTPTIAGTFYAVGPISEWYYMKTSNVWVRYAFQIKGNYFFHSVLFNRKGAKTPTSTSVANLGSNVSHGCIRLAVDDVKWIYQNCTKGMKVIIE